MATPTEIKDRIVVLAGQVSGVTTTLDDYPEAIPPFQDAALPAMVTRLMQAPAQRQFLSSDMYLVTRTFTMLLHVAETRDEVLFPDTATMESCEAFLSSVPKYFAERIRLGDPVTGLSDLVYDCQLMADGGIQKIIRESQAYWGVVFRLPVVESENF